MGIVLYELLTGALPFRGETLNEQIQNICGQDPPLPRRINPSVPGDLQNICLKALEKNPADRYKSARDMTSDLERFFAGEPVLASPTSYSRLMAGKIEQHLRELSGWRQDRILSNYEFDAFRKLYDRLIDREDAWIMEVRRLTLSQVSLYLGAWILVVGASLTVLFHYPSLAGTPAVIAVAATCISTCILGIRNWKLGQSRIALAFLLAFCLLLPSTFLLAMNEYGWFTRLTQGREELEFLRRYFSFERATNAQLWWAILLCLPAYFWLRRFTRASVFSLVMAVMTAQLALVLLLRMGMLEWLEKDPGKAYFHLIPIALFFFGVGFWIERLRCTSDSRYFYPFAVVFTYAAMSGVAAFHKPYAQWLKRMVPWTRGQVEYLFIINALIYLLLQFFCERFSSAQLRSVAKAFRFVVAGHVLLPLLLLGIAATDLWNGSPDNLGLRREARTFEVILPLVAGLFAFSSIPKQMKNYFATGLIFLAIGIIRLQQDYFEDKAAWPLSLLLLGLILMLAAANYTPLKILLTRAVRRKP